MADLAAQLPSPDRPPETTEPSRFPWRPPLSADWYHRLRDLGGRLDALLQGPGDGVGAAVELRRLAGQRLGPMENVKLARVAAKAFRAREHLPTLRPVRIALLGSRTLDYLAPELCAAAPARGLLVDPVVGKYGSAAAIALGAEAWDTNGPVDAVLVMLDESAFQLPTALLDPGLEAERLKAAVEYLRRLVENLRQRLAASVIVGTIPLRPEVLLASADGSMAGTPGRFVAGLNTAIAAGAERGDWIVFDAASLAAEIGTRKWFDPVRFHLGKLPFALELTPFVADRICALLAAMTGKAGRALVLDLDNTLWGGVIGDDGLEGIRIGQGSPEGEAFLAFQRLVLELRGRGIVLAVCSKNDEDVAQRPFREHPDMLLRLDHIAVFQVNWRDKASNVESIAQALNLGQDALVFVDDNPAERERVRQELPLVQVPELSDDPAFFPRLLVASGAFEHLVLNRDDLNRAGSYQSRAVAARQVEIGNYGDYLQSLQMRMTAVPFDKVGRSRIIQLISKSNQFNLTTRRYNDVQVAALEGDPAVLTWQVRLSDVFSDHGMICVIIVHKTPSAWDIDTWLMSCRVLERGVEQTLMNALFDAARAAGVKKVTGSYIRTGRNRLVEDFFDRFGFRKVTGVQTAQNRRDYELRVDEFQPRPTEIVLDLARHAEVA